MELDNIHNLVDLSKSSFSKTTKNILNTISIDDEEKVIKSGPNNINFDFATMGKINTTQNPEILIAEEYPLTSLQKKNLNNIADFLISNPNATIRFQYTNTSALNVKEAKKVEEIYGKIFLQLTNYLIKRGVSSPNKRILKSLGDRRSVILNK